MKISQRVTKLILRKDNKMAVYLQQLENVINNLNKNYKEITLRQEGVDYFKEILEKNKNKRVNRSIFNDFNGHKMLIYEKDEHNRVALSIDQKKYYNANRKELHIEVCCEAKYSTDWLHTLAIDDTINTWEDVLKAWNEKEQGVNKLEEPNNEEIENDYMEVLKKKNELNDLLYDFCNKYKVMLDK